jgi:hypothetical protein
MEKTTRNDEAAVGVCEAHMTQCLGKNAMSQEVASRSTLESRLVRYLFEALKH